MNKILTAEERTKLIKQHRHERDGRVRDRIKVVIAYDDGYTYSEIAKILLLEDTTVSRHVGDYLNTKKLNLVSGGSESKLTEQETQELREHLREVTYLYVKDVCAYVRQSYGKPYSVSGMTKWLHVQGFRYKKPHAVPAKANRDQQELAIGNRSILPTVCTHNIKPN